MIPKPATLMLLALALLIGTAAGEAADDVVYVTDELRLGLFDGEGTTGRPARMLTSGNKLQILERALRSIRVRTEDGDRLAFFIEPFLSRVNLVRGPEGG